VTLLSALESFYQINKQYREEAIPLLNLLQKFRTLNRRINPKRQHSTQNTENTTTRSLPPTPSLPAYMSSSIKLPWLRCASRSMWSWIEVKWSSYPTPPALAVVTPPHLRRHHEERRWMTMASAHNTMSLALMAVSIWRWSPRQQRRPQASGLIRHSCKQDYNP
jgi:hypothetical protein